MIQDAGKARHGSDVFSNLGFAAAAAGLRVEVKVKKAA